MHSAVLSSLAAAMLAAPASAFIRFGCANNLVEERADPIVNPGAIAGHAHKIVGGSGFGLSMDYNQARASKCSSCPIKEDMSNYWTPKLYFQAADGTFQSVPTVGDNMNDLNGGQTVYYLQRGSKTLKAFPEGFRMLAGDPMKRSGGNDFATQGISFACLGANQPETNSLPNYNCPGGLRAQVFFPSCWDGKNLDSENHRDHMSYPATGAYNAGTCPDSHPVQLISLFYEVLYDTNQFKDKWTNGQQPFVFANGDPTGYGYHGDFVNGWDVNVLQQVVDQCDDLAAQGSLDACKVITQFTGAEQNACRLPSAFNEQVAGKMATLPGCNPIQKGPAAATQQTCDGKTNPAIGSGGSMYFTDETSKGWAYLGCATDGSTRTLTDKTTLYSAGVGDKMTVDYCLDYCKGYTYAGLEYANQCYCGNNVASDRMPVAGIFGNCNMKCAGDNTQTCGGPNALTLYKVCSGGTCQNAGSSNVTTAPVSGAGSGTGSGTGMGTGTGSGYGTGSGTGSGAAAAKSVAASNGSPSAGSSSKQESGGIADATSPYGNAKGVAPQAASSAAAAPVGKQGSVSMPAVVNGGAVASATRVTMSTVTVSKKHHCNAHA